MINYALKCAEGHGFESWFQSGSAFDSLKAARMVTCPVCGSCDVAKAVMAPRIASGPNAAETTAPVAAAPEPTLSGPPSPAEEALKKLKAHIRDNADYVGRDFATEARAIHDGDMPDRAIYGETSPADAHALIKDGVPVAPLPFNPRRKEN